jgi:hypothetical protein
MNGFILAYLLFTVKYNQSTIIWSVNQVFGKGGKLVPFLHLKPVKVIIISPANFKKGHGYMSL